ncbi:MAG: HPP family protein [Polyangiaceae bacterium]
MKKNDPISHLMTKNPATVHTRQNVSDVRRLMTENRFHHVPVVSGDKLLGMVSASDLLAIRVEGVGADDRAMDAYLDQQFTIEGIMCKDLRKLKTTDTVRDAAGVLAGGSFHALPVVDAEDRLQGIVTSTDLVRYLLDQY